MKHLVLSILTVIAGLTAVAQNYNMEITLSDGTKQYIPADKVSEVRFVTDSETPGQAFNILSLTACCAMRSRSRWPGEARPSLMWRPQHIPVNLSLPTTVSRNSQVLNISPRFHH